MFTSTGFWELSNQGRWSGFGADLVKELSRMTSANWTIRTYDGNSQGYGYTGVITNELGAFLFIIVHSS